jgi:hypothetical protein
MIKRIVPQTLRTFSFVSDAVLVDGDRVAMLSRQSARRTIDDRVVSYRVANFIRFKDNKVVDNISLLDSFDVVEQLIGHRLAFASSAINPADTAELIVV